MGQIEKAASSKPRANCTVAYFKGLDLMDHVTSYQIGNTFCTNLFDGIVSQFKVLTAYSCEINLSGLAVKNGLIVSPCKCTKLPLEVGLWKMISF